MWQEEGTVRIFAWGAQKIRDKNVILQALNWHRLAIVMCLLSLTVTRGQSIPKRLSLQRQPTP